MRRALSSFAVLAAFAVFADAYEVRDSRGETFEFSSPPTAATIVPSVTENIYLIGADEYLIANSRYCVRPDAAKDKIKIGGFLDPDYEKIATLKPQIFILPHTAKTSIAARIEKLGVRCFVLNPEGLGNISADVRMLGELFQKREEAGRVAARLDCAIKKSDAGKNRRALFMFGRMAAGRGSFVGDMMGACGLNNAADVLGRPWTEVSREFILTANPEIIFVEVENDAARVEAENFYRTDAVWKNADAVKNSKICYVPRALVMLPSARVADAIAYMREFCALH